MQTRDASLERTTELSVEPSGAPSVAWWFFLVLVLTVVGLVLPAALAHHYGALAVPRSDDWSYLRTLFTWDRSGRWDFNNWVSMTLVGQVLISTPVLAVFGRSITAVRLFWACVGVGGLLATAWLGLELRLPKWWAALLAVTIAACPLWGPLAPTFMTDVPAFAFQMLALALAGVAFRRRPMSMPFLAASIASGFVAVSIRQYAAIPLFAIVASALWVLAFMHDRKRLRTALVFAAVLAVGLVLMFHWWSGVPRAKSLSPRMFDGYSIRLAFENGAGFLRLAGLMLVPVILVARPADIARRAWRLDRPLTRLVGGITVAWLTLAYLLNSDVPFVGNYFDRRGVLADDIIHGNRPNIMSPFLFDVLAIIGSLAALTLVLAAIPFLSELVAQLRDRQVRTPDPSIAMLGLSIVGFAVVYELAIVVRLPIFDRYALPAIPIIGLLLLCSVRHRATAPDFISDRDAGRAHIAAVSALLILAFLGIVYTAESASYDSARWHVAELATRAGYSRKDIYAGYEWSGWYQNKAPLFAPTIAERKRLRREYLAGTCVAVVINPPHLPKPRVAAVRSVGLLRSPTWVVAERIPRRCAVPPKPGASASG